MTNKKTIIISLFLMVILSTAFGAQPDYWIEDMNVDIRVGKDAVFDISENYVFNYQTPHHGFVRDIPFDYSSNGVSRKVKITSVKCSDFYTSEISNGYKSLKIGDSDHVIEGKKEYTLSYFYDIGADTNEGYDEFYYNLVGMYWECPIKRVSFKVEIPCSQKDTDGYIFLSRGFYSSELDSPFNVTETENTIVITGDCYDMEPQEALTLRVQLPDNWYENARVPYDGRSVWKILAPVLSVVCLVICILIWATQGRDTVPIITARFESPEGFSPLVEGYLSDMNVDDKDVTSMLYYWADKGLITISEESKNKFVFTKINEISFDVPDFERKLFYAFFKSGDVVTIDDLKKSNFYEDMIKCKLAVSHFFSRSKRLKKPGSIVFSFLSFLLSLCPLVFASCAAFLKEGSLAAVVLFAVISFVFSLWTFIGFKNLFKKWYSKKTHFFPLLFCLIPIGILIVVIPFLLKNFRVQFYISIICMGLCLFLASITDKRTEYGTQVLEGTLGYREFIEKVQVSELITMIDKDPMLYYHVLGYAIVFGLENKWAKKFAAVAVPPPVWYTGPSMFDYLYFTRMASRINTVVKTAVVKAQINKVQPGLSLGGSSFGSHGFAGGGFGGGGGHAW